MGDRVFLGDHPAHRDAEQVEALDAQRVHESGEILGHLRRAVRPGRSRRLPHAAVVVADHAIALGERGDLGLPRLLCVGEAIHEHERLGTVAVDLEAQFEAIGLDGGHDSPRLYVMNAGMKRVRVRAPATMLASSTASPTPWMSRTRGP